MSDLTYDDAIEILLTCVDCKRVHELRVIQEESRQISWADPVDGHAYRAPFKEAGRFLRNVKPRAQEIKNERPPLSIPALCICSSQDDEPDPECPRCG